MYIKIEAQEQCSLIDTKLNYIFDFGPPGKYLFMSNSTADGRSVTQSPQDHVPQLTTKRDQSSLKTGLVASEVQGQTLLIINSCVIKGVAECK